MSLQWTSWLAGLHFIPTPRRYSKNVHTVGGSTLMSNPQPFDINLLFILYHITIFLFHFIIYNRKGNPFVHILLKNGTPFTYMYLVNNFSFLIRSSRLMVQQSGNLLHDCHYFSHITKFF